MSKNGYNLQMNSPLAAPEMIDWAERSLRWSRKLMVPLYIVMALALLAAFLYAPTEREMGIYQRIFYFHVGAALNAFLAFLVVGVAGVAYLRSRRLLWDQVAVSAVEVGLVLTTIVLTTGPIWARPAWGTWFPWGDPRLMTTLVLWVMYAAYLILRTGLPEGEKKYRFAAVFGIVCFVNVPIVYKSIDWWRTLHPKVITMSGDGLETRMWHAFWVALAAFAVLLGVLVLLRTSMRLNQLAAEELQLSAREMR